MCNMQATATDLGIICQVKIEPYSKNTRDGRNQKRVSELI